MITCCADNISYEPCVVSFIDVLGFREMINSLKAPEIYNIMTKLTKFTQSQQDSLDAEMFAENPRSHSRAFSYKFSDSIIRVRPYNTQYQDGALFLELIDLLHAQIQLIEIGVLIRAGVTVGEAYVGMNGEGPVFGPAVVRAYEIENFEAIFPRIAIDEHALKVHEIDHRLRSGSNNYTDDVNAINELLITGDDGVKFIDYIRAGYSEFYDPEVYHLLFLESHAVLIRKALNKFASGPVRTKYKWMAFYHNRFVNEVLDKDNNISNDDIAILKSLIIT